MNKIIKFSHCYPKLRNHFGQVVKTATLLEVVKIDLEALHPAFRDYDTDAGKNGRYALPEKGPYLMLIFLKKQCGFGEMNLLTTLRRWTPDKERYYAGLCGEIFTVQIVDTAKKAEA